MSLRDGILWSLAAVLLLTVGSPPLQAQGEALAPSDQAAFDDLVVGQRMALDDDLFSSFYYVDFVAAGRFRETESPGIFTGSYTYENTGPNTGTLTFHFDDGVRFTERLKLVFTSTTAGTATSTVNGEEIPQFNWRLNPMPESEPLRTLYFPDYVDGGGWSVQLAISHIGTTEDAAVLVTAYDRDGQSIPGFFDFDDPFEIPPLGTRVFRSAGAGEARRGWIEVKTDTASVSGLLTYRNTGTGLEVSVEPVELGNHFALFVEESSGIGTGLAIFKPDPASTIEFRIRDEDGIDPLGEGFVTHPVGGETFQQRVGSIPEWFDVDGIDTEFPQDFQGILLLRSEDGSLFAPVGIRFGKRGESLSAVPVIQVTGEDGTDDGDMPPPLAPADEVAFNTLFVGKRAVTNFPAVYVDFVSPGRFRETRVVEISTGSYAYRNTGPNTGTVTFNYDDGDRCTASLTFDSTTSGTATSTCNDGSSVDYDWRLVEIP